jgi:hypothetical protein
MSKIKNEIYDVFISYRREGGETMGILLHDRLTAKGYNVFLDVESLNAGTFNSQLLTVIESCTDVIVVLSQSSLARCANEGDWVRQELAHAFKHKKNVIPFMLRGFEWDCELPEDIAELPLRNGVNASSNEYFDASIERLVTKFLKSESRNLEEQKSAPKLAKLAGIAAACIFGVAIVFILANLLLSGDDESLAPPNSANSGTDAASVPTTASQPTSPEPPSNADYSDRVTNRTLAASSRGIAAVKSDGTVVSFDIEEDLSGWSDIVSVSVGFEHTLGLKSDGTVVAMGSNSDGQGNVADWRDIIAIEAGPFFSLGIRRNGAVVAAGIRFPYHEQINQLKDVIALATGLNHIVALKADGTVEVIGPDSSGEGMVSGWSDIVEIAAGSVFTMGVKSDGTIVMAGEEPNPDWDSIASLAIGRDIIGLRIDGTVIAPEQTSIQNLQELAEWSDIVAVAVSFHNVVGLRSDGTVVYTRWMRFDDIGDTLDDWSGIRVG